MPIVIWLSLSFFVGLISLPVVAFCLARASRGLFWYAWFLFGISQAPWVYEPPAWKIRRYAAGIVGLCVLVVLFSVAVGEAFFNDHAFNVEKALQSELYVHVAAAFGVGLLVALYQSKLGDNIGAAIRSLKDGETIPWQTQVAAIVLLALLVLVSMKPEVLNRLALFKAGEVEAHFTEASSSTIKEAPIVFSDFGHKEVLQDWSRFDIISLYSNLKEEKCNIERQIVYEDIDVDTMRLQISKKILSKMLRHMFILARQFESVGLADIVRNNVKFRAFIELFADTIKKSEVGTSPDLKAEIDKLKNIEDEASTELTSISADLKLTADKLPPDECSGAPQDQFASGQITIDFAHVQGKTVWDPYIIAPVADLIAFVDDQSARAEFLNDVSLPLADPTEPCKGDKGDKGCSGLTPGAINLLYSTVDAKVKSHWTWPLDAQVKYLEKALDGIEQILTRSGRSGKNCLADARKPRCAISPYFLKSKFVELSLGLELYYRHALSGEILDKQNRVQWQFWLDDMQRILDVLLGIHPVKLAPFVDEYATGWREAAEGIQDDDGGGLIADAESGVALGIILLARQTGTPSADECLAAEALSTHLLNHQFPSMADRHQVNLGPSQLEAYKGLIIQFDNRIRAECSAR